MSKVHYLKTVQPYFSHVRLGLKKFEIRLNDRDFMVGDELALQEWDAEKNDYVEGSPLMVRTISYITNYEQKEGFVVLGLERG